jgi:16S rRNA (guanine527-N7)-methyltransferase
MQKMNLTAVTERGAMMDRHITDSLALLPTIEEGYAAYSTPSQGEFLKVVDIGSGAGLPGVVLAIARPGAAI